MKDWIKRQVLKLIDWCEKRGRVHHITGGKRGKEVYLVRYILFKSKWWCIYIHRFMRSDADVPHDHPWNFFTYIVSGGYTEHYFNVDQPIELKTKFKSLWTETKFKSLWTETTNVREAGSLAYRRALDIHRVELDRNYTLDEIEDAPLTICFIGPRLRHWGFWPDSGTWIDWRSYLNIKPNDSRIEGSE